MDNLLVLILFVSLITCIFYYLREYEQFDQDMTGFPPIGEKRYDMAGRLLSNRPMCDCLCDRYGTCYTGNNY